MPEVLFVMLIWFTLIYYLVKRKISVVSLGETRIDENNEDKIAFPGYKCFVKSRIGSA